MKICVRMAACFLLITAYLITSSEEIIAKEKTRGTVTFIFDDGKINVADKVYPIFKKHKLQASVAIYTNVIGKKGYLTKQSMLDFSKNEWEILSHGVSHKSLKTLSNQSIDTELTQSKKIFNSYGIKVRGFVAPYSYFPDNKTNQLKEHYSFAFSGYVDSRKEPVKNLIANSKNKYNIVRANMEGKTLKELKEYIDYAQQNALWLVLYEHEVGTKNHLSTNDLDALLNYAKHKKISVRNPSKVYGLK